MAKSPSPLTYLEGREGGRNPKNNHSSEGRECAFAYSMRTEHQFASNLACLYFETTKRFQKGKNSEKVYSV
jgi:hypothetical protein